MPEHDAPETVEARAVRDSVIELSREHERRAHGGEPCLGNRVGLAAFLVHALGLGPIHLPLVAREIEQYEAQHRERHG
jgi:hypothetical protein